MRADQQTETLDQAVVQAIASITQTVDESVKATLIAAADAAKSIDVSVESEVRSKVVNGIEKLQKGLLERETEVRIPHTTGLLLRRLLRRHQVLWTSGECSTHTRIALGLPANLTVPRGHIHHFCFPSCGNKTNAAAGCL